MHQKDPNLQMLQASPPKTDATRDVQRGPSDAAQDRSDIHCQFPPRVNGGCHHKMSSIITPMMLLFDGQNLAVFRFSILAGYPHSGTQPLVDEASGIQTNSMEGPCFTSSSRRVKPVRFTVCLVPVWGHVQTPAGWWFENL